MDFASAGIPNIAFERAAHSLSAGGAADAAPRVTDRETAVEFEAFFLSQVFAQMFSGVQTDPVFGGGPGEDVFRSMMVEEYGRAVAKAGGVGVADAVMREILRMQEEH